MTTMSLEKIDEYMKQLKAVTDYDRVCKQLKMAREEWSKEHLITYFNSLVIDSLRSKIDEQQKELNEINAKKSWYAAILDKQTSIITMLEYALKKAEKEVQNLRHEKESTTLNIQYPREQPVQLTGFLTLDVIIDDSVTHLRKKMNAIYLWLVENRYLLL